MRLEINRPVNKKFQYVASDATYIYDLRTKSKPLDLVFRTICTLDERTVDAMLDNQELANKTYVVLWIEDMADSRLFGLYQHDDNTYLVQAKMSEVRELVQDGRFWLSDFLKGLVM